MKLRRINRFAVGFALIAAGLAPPSSSAGTYTLSVAPYSSPSYATGSFSVQGTPSANLTLIPGTPRTVVLDSGVITSGTGNGSYSGSATGNMTLDGSTESLTDAFTFNVTSFTQTVNWTGGASIMFNIGSDMVTVTPIASTGQRSATFLESAGLGAPVPEPTSILMVGQAALAALGIRARRRFARRG